MTIHFLPFMFHPKKYQSNKVCSIPRLSRLACFFIPSFVYSNIEQHYIDFTFFFNIELKTTKNNFFMLSTWQIEFSEFFKAFTAHFFGSFLQNHQLWMNKIAYLQLQTYYLQLPIKPAQFLSNLDSSLCHFILQTSQQKFATKNWRCFVDRAVMMKIQSWFASTMHSGSIWWRKIKFVWKQWKKL